MIKYQLYPKNLRISEELLEIVGVFDNNSKHIDSFHHTLKSNAVLNILTADLIKLEYAVELGKKEIDKIQVPVLYGENGSLDKFFYADAYSSDKKIVLEVEAGRAYANFQFLKDVFEACLMDEMEYLVIAVRQIYNYGNTSSEDYKKISLFLNTLYTSNRLKLPLKGILIIGY